MAKFPCLKIFVLYHQFIYNQDDQEGQECPLSGVLVGIGCLDVFFLSFQFGVIRTRAIMLCKGTLKKEKEKKEKKTF